MDGDLLRPPNFKFGLDFPNLDQTNRSQIDNLFRDNEEEINRQVFGLLVLKSFVAPASALNANQAAGGGAVSGGASATGWELISNQLSNLLSQNENVNIGVNYRSANEVSEGELSVAMSTQLLNDRLSVNGNFATGGNSTNNYVGDVEVQYDLTEDGKIKAKAFNRTNQADPLTGLSTSGSRQGVGVFYQEEFNDIDELTDRFKKMYHRYWQKIKGRF
jgi:hypothetical protein